ncbi:MAG TPA: glycosyltransferase family 4 protein [Pseudonocardiaceae bacterium]|nr:glycosyltransferase family 4 protein [Pseudonocardiaceae bacterium]
MSGDGLLRIALLSYRGNPRAGGQGVYVRQLSRELRALGHHVEVISGPPYPMLAEGIPLTGLRGLDLFAEPNPFRTPALRELRGIPDWVEFAGMRRGGFPEPLAFSLRALAVLARRRRDFDIVHDNQCLGYGLLGVPALGLPVLATVHHPVAIDRDLDVAHAVAERRPATLRWYRFTAMQRRVAGRLNRIITPSLAAKHAIAHHLRVPGDRVDVVPVGVDHTVFRPDPAATRVPGRIVSTASADVPLKGLDTLIAAGRRLLDAGRRFELVVVGTPRAGGATATALADHELADRVTFRTGLSDVDLVDLLRSAEIACVPSRYEGFSLPAAEAMACGTPLVATDAGALPEVVGPAGLLVPPDDPDRLADALGRLLTEPELRAGLAAEGIARARGFTWRRCAEATVAGYRRSVSAC